MFDKNLVNKFSKLETPFYFYDTNVLKRTLDSIKTESEKRNYIIHYAVKANANDEILRIIKEYGLGADCVSGNEITKAIESGFKSKDIVFAGVGKSDLEIITALKHNIFCFNVESEQELEIINSLAKSSNQSAQVAIRINPNINAKTHHYITTGLEENKFGINEWELSGILEKIKSLKNIKLTGLHFHIGSQVTDLEVFKGLALRINEIQEWFVDHNIKLEHINAGGGLGIDYEHPDENQIPDFKSFFEIFENFLQVRTGQKVHFEIGRAIVAQCGSLVSRVLYIKKGENTSFAILDAGMTELIRPALYQAYHKIENLTSDGVQRRYDVVGPICESSDTFAKAILLPETKRGDLIAIRSTGAYGEEMSLRYNLRPEVSSVFSDDIF